MDRFVMDLAAAFAREQRRINRGKKLYWTFSRFNDDGCILFPNRKDAQQYFAEVKDELIKEEIGFTLVRMQYDLEIYFAEWEVRDNCGVPVALFYYKKDAEEFIKDCKRATLSIERIEKEHTTNWRRI